MDGDSAGEIYLSAFDCGARARTTWRASSAESSQRWREDRSTKVCKMSSGMIVQSRNSVATLGCGSLPAKQRPAPHLYSVNRRNGRKSTKPVCTKTRSAWE